MLTRHGKFFWKLFLGNALLLIAVVAACVLAIVSAFDRFYEADLSAHLRLHAARLRHEIGDMLDEEHRAELERLAHDVDMVEPHALRITLISAAGVVLGDSWSNAESMENHAGRDEVRAALATGWGESTRYSTTIGQNLKYVAMRVGDAGTPRGIVRVALPVRSIVARTHTARTLFIEIGAAVLVAAVALALGLARMWGGRIARVTESARSLSRGDLSARAVIVGNDEVALLARALNRMRDRLAYQLEANTRQKRMLESLVGQLHEGVLVIDAEGQTRWINPAAARFLNWPAPDPADEMVELTASEARSWPELPDEIVALVGQREGSAAVMGECRITLRRPSSDLALLVRSSDLVLPIDGEREGSASTLGRLLVLTDITELAQTLQMKTDFAANASHELRTPLTAIRAAVETLLSLDFATEAPAAQRLLGVVDRQTARLNALIADLLDLARVEDSAMAFESAPVVLEDVWVELRERFGERVSEKNLNWRIDCDPAVEMLTVNRELFGLVVDNLVDNAIKFTDDGGRIEIVVRGVGNEVCVSVADNGCGIAPQEQDRVFERFYQVERARTAGAKRGTGLGLAIVRHAVNAMHGRIKLESTLGAGTRIDVYVPVGAQHVQGLAALGIDR
jgi:two-component system phosphate regulon sensor histidine kinase PhoR